MKFLGQAVFYALFMGAIGFLSVRPELRLLADDEAIVSVSFSHAGQRLGECRRLTQDELNALPPNMRTPDDCPRGRHSVRVRLQVDGEVLYEDELPPSGLWSDGKSVAYRRQRVNAGLHRIRMELDDAGSAEVYGHSEIVEIDLRPGQNFVIGFDELSQTFIFK
jgi:hypothetical protein